MYSYLNLRQHFFIPIIIWLLAVPAFAQAPTAYAAAPDSTLRVATATERGSANTHRQYKTAINPAFDDYLQQALANVNTRRQLLAGLRTANPVSNQTRNTYYRLAGLFSKAKLYPQAVKCYLKSGAHYAYADLSAADEQLADSLLSLSSKHLHRKSAPINYSTVAQVFEDGKTANGYAIIVHIRQPVPGKAKVHKLANSGHSFITLMKFNSDTTTTTLSFSYYPKHQHPFAGTPLFPMSHGTLKNDAGYDTDELVAKAIDKIAFDSLLALTQRYSQSRYNLNKHNCTDFTLDAAKIAGINIIETKGSWPLGKGNNPGITGQSILQGKLYNTATGSTDGLFIYFDDKLLTTKQ
ncbi:hypothetical protein FPZ43_13655 [Mucilaginibacter pallidiroseus]|uniref:DUF4105 domain-containing protein n=1 Tax=Mucilaginibacter pallidiroseus TaxID=2599295 RepID=A0A563U848_9SPHI|nr:hypothetical protein [Mucilaginibacter pallidiroseus]TWR27515.1 hypothetical protein FPZ43_13655 [Mucilaginibacter pallidiroseus]